MESLASQNEGLPFVLPQSRQIHMMLPIPGA
jgi:hypothetical protein